MNKSTKILISSLITFTVSVCIFAFSVTLNISDIADLDSKLVAILPVRNLSYCLFAFSIGLFVVYFLSKKAAEVKTKRVITALIAIFSIGVLTAVSAPLVDYSSVEYSYDLFEDSHSIKKEYKKYFPYYDDMAKVSKSSDDVIYLFENYKVFSTEYTHIQNFVDLRYAKPLYDVEYFCSNDNLLMNRFNSENAVLDKKVKEDSYKGITYQLVKDDDIYQIRIKEKNVIYIFSISDYDDLSIDFNTILDNAFVQYKMLKK